MHPNVPPGLGTMFAVWARVAALSFGGPAGQIAVMHRILVEERRWIDEARFLHALNFCMLLPGPEAQQLATYIGWLTGGVRGALIAGVLFILPGVAAIMALSWIYVLLGDVAVIEGLFLGLKAAVLAIVVQAVVRLAGKALPSTPLRLLAFLAFLALFAFDAPFPLVIAAAAAIGAVAIHAPPPPVGPALTAPDAGAARRAALWALALWLLPVGALLAAARGSVFADIAVFFSKLAVLTFGGAYAALAWVAQEAAGPLGWLQPGEMLDGLGMAETTPGPLIMVLQFVGFMAALREAGWAQPLLAATAGGLLATWVTFAPCFAWIFLGAPFMEGLRRNRRLAAALRAVTAAVVGVILNLALWFAVHLVWTQTVQVKAGALQVELPVPLSIDPAAAMLSALALVAALRLRIGMGLLLAGSGLAGMALHLLGAT
ncbi:chromate efflux transporter [Paracoccus beibuensis]|uniref:chromate efflux transporter n=1 Tax=Paracoccus beibuensis TaxID=547602 RepID=UPI002240B906|nr:chromate efflux transporter [Paracoccus beibuensis]